MGLDCELTILNHTDYGNENRSTGEWQGLIRQVHASHSGLPHSHPMRVQILDGEFDVGSLDFNPTKARMAVVDFTRSVYAESFYFTTRFGQGLLGCCSIPSLTPS